MTPKEIVRSYYESDLVHDQGVVDTYLHKDCILHWHNSKGYSRLNFNQIKNLYDKINSAYETTRVQISHLVAEGDTVTTRFTFFVTPIETPDEEQPLAHFITVWELKDDQLYKGYEISQKADSSLASLASFQI
ncbi:SnoaL-like domain-containing protein [Flavobacteriaceae bacterium MAR_2010_188]|nr:SnoaL-like domain-containing protein [Flavobacteriaceae bacterium MAR_2010_188]